MSEHFKDGASSASQQVELDVTAVLKKMQQQLAFLEKKIDILIKQSSEKSFKERHFSKPFRPGGFSHFYRPSEGGHGNSPREKDFAQGRHFDKQQGNANREFGRGRKAFFRRRKDRG